MEKKSPGCLENIQSIHKLVQCARRHSRVLQNFSKKTLLIAKKFLFVLIIKALALWANAFYKSICPYMDIYVCVFTFEVPFKRLFSLTSQSWKSNIFRDSESLEKSAGNKWFQIWKLLLIKGVKSPRKIEFFLLQI